MDTEQLLRDSGIIDVIQTLSSNGETGQLQIKTGTTSGAFFFKNGLLVDARVGTLSGFQAINAAASLRDASFSFDPSVAPPSFSSITPNERVVLKQFFGIDTVAPEDTIAAEEFHEPEQFIADEGDELTLVRSNVPSDELPSDELPTPLPYIPSSTSFQRSGGLAVAAVVFLFAIAAVALLYKFGGEYNAPAAAPSVPSVPSVASTGQPSSPAVAEPAKPQVASIDHDAHAPRDLTGKWNIVNTVQKTSYNSYNNLKIGFDLSIEQSGKGFTGKGVKVSENGRSLPASSQTPIQVKGSIDGDRVEATFFEQGTARKSNGRFVWRINKAGGLSGTFNTNAAHSSGKSTARKT